MSLAMARLPTDPDALRAFAARLQTELYAKTLHIEKLKAELALLKRARYGRQPSAKQPARRRAAASRCRHICRASGSSTKLPVPARSAAAPA
jgi:hypothetical protein